MNELKPEDVMRALECCTFNPNCEECPFGGEDCINLDQIALALLREKHALIELLQDDLFRAKNLYCDLVSESKAKDAEIERLTAQIEHCDACDRIGLTHSEHIVCIKQARAEAIDEFADALEKHFCHDPAFLGVEQRLIMDVVKQKTKELKGGTPNA